MSNNENEEYAAWKLIDYGFYELDCEDGNNYSEAGWEAAMKSDKIKEIEEAIE